MSDLNSNQYAKIKEIHFLILLPAVILLFYNYLRPFLTHFYKYLLLGNKCRNVEIYQHRK